MHYYLFEHQKALDDSHLFEYAQKVGLNIDRFKKEMSGHIYASLINESLRMELIVVLKAHRLSLLMEYIMKTH
jgi:hypothetical protein